MSPIYYKNNWTYNLKVISINEHINLYLKFIFSYLLINKGINNQKFIEDKQLEFAWTLIPCLILATISVPSFYVLYINEEILNPGLTVNIMGHQWYCHLIILIYFLIGIIFLKIL